MATRSGAKKSRPHAHFGDMLTAVLCQWGPGRLGHLMGAMKVALEALPNVKQECDVMFALTARVIIPMRTGIQRVAPNRALDHFYKELKTLQTRLDEDRLGSIKLRPSVSEEWQRRLSEGARALFLILFFRDGRVRRLVMGQHSGHAVWRTSPPDEDRLRAFFEQGACGTVNTYIGVMEREDLDDETAGGQTHDFVIFMLRWWVFGSPALAASVPEKSL